MRCDVVCVTQYLVLVDEHPYSVYLTPDGLQCEDMLTGALIDDEKTAREILNKGEVIDETVVPCRRQTVVKLPHKSSPCYVREMPKANAVVIDGKVITADQYKSYRKFEKVIYVPCSE